MEDNTPRNQFNPTPRTVTMEIDAFGPLRGNLYSTNGYEPQMKAVEDYHRFKQIKMENIDSSFISTSRKTSYEELTANSKRKKKKGKASATTKW